MQRIHELIYSDILEFHRRALKFFKQRGLHKSDLVDFCTSSKCLEASKQPFHSAWKDFRTHFQGILESLRQHKDLMENQATLIEYQASSDTRYKVREDIRKTEHAMVEEQLISVRDWLCSTKTSEYSRSL